MPSRSRDESRHRLGVRCMWEVKVRQTGSGLYVPVLRRKNTFTTNGLSMLASAIGGGYTPPIYLMMDGLYATVSTSIAAGATAVTLSSVVTGVGDSQLVLSVGLSNQETVTFSSVSGTTYTLSSPTTKAHNSGEPCVRQPTVNDAVSFYTSPIYYDPTNAPNQWPSQSAGYGAGAGAYTVQFYLTAVQARAFIASVGLTDSQVPGYGTLHNVAALGFDHTASGPNANNDMEIDVTLSITNV